MSVNQHLREPIINSQINSRSSTAHSQNDLISYGDAQQSLQPSIYATIPSRQYAHVDSHTNSVRSSSNSSTPRNSPTTSYQKKQQDDKIPYRAPSATSSSRQSSSRFPPPPPSLKTAAAETSNFDNDPISIRRPPSVMSIRSSVHSGANEPLPFNKVNKFIVYFFFH